MRLAFDTAVLVCAEGIGDLPRCTAARDLALHPLLAAALA